MPAGRNPSANPDGTPHHPHQVNQVCRREDLADLVADTPLGPEQAAARLRVRRADVDHMVRFGWVRSPQSIEVRFGTSRAGAVDVPLCTTDSVDAIPAAHPENRLGAAARREEGPTLPARPPVPGTGVGLLRVQPSAPGPVVVPGAEGGHPA
ncbi:hypothetical protein GCM10010236_79600 [Streptomyces eurythermus]|nr:hypothetical protein GCM10010236_79600 [Streptomyces eurythermus]